VGTVSGSAKATQVDCTEVADCTCNQCSSYRRVSCGAMVIKPHQAAFSNKMLSDLSLVFCCNILVCSDDHISTV